jgi:hypothetical protein
MIDVSLVTVKFSSSNSRVTLESTKQDGDSVCWLKLSGGTINSIAWQLGNHAQFELVHKF